MEADVAHVLFMQGKQIQESHRFLYRPIVKKHYDNILKVSLCWPTCVFFIYYDKLNEEAEELMRRLKKRKSSSPMMTQIRKSPISHCEFGDEDHFYCIKESMTLVFEHI